MELRKVKVHKAGKKAYYTSDAIPFTISLPATAVPAVDGAPQFPEVIQFEAEGLRTVSASDAARLAEKNAARVAEGKKPLPTADEKAAKLVAAQARDAKRAEKRAAQLAKLAAKGVVIPTAETQAAPATDAPQGEGEAAQG